MIRPVWHLRAQACKSYVVVASNLHMKKKILLQPTSFAWRICGRSTKLRSCVFMNSFANPAEETAKVESWPTLRCMRAPCSLAKSQESNVAVTLAAGASFLRWVGSLALGPVWGLDSGPWVSSLSSSSAWIWKQRRRRWEGTRGSEIPLVGWETMMGSIQSIHKFRGFWLT